MVGLGKATGPRSRVRDPYHDAQRWDRIGDVASTVGVIGWLVALLAQIGKLVFG